MPATCVWPASSAATPGARAMDWMSGSMPFFANVPSSAAIQNGRKSPIGLLYEIVSFTGAGVAVARATLGAALAPVPAEPPQAATISSAAAANAGRISAPPCGEGSLEGGQATSSRRPPLKLAPLDSGGGGAPHVRHGD